MPRDDASHPAPRPDPPAPTGGEEIVPGITAPPGAIKWSAVRASGPGGQNVNKVSTAAELRVLVAALGLAHGPLSRLRAEAGRRINTDGWLVIENDEFRSLQQNRRAAWGRLVDLVRSALIEPKRRVKTKPTKGSKVRRVDAKKRRSGVKSARRRPQGDD